MWMSHQYLIIVTFLNLWSSLLSGFSLKNGDMSHMSNDPRKMVHHPLKSKKCLPELQVFAAVL